MSRVEFCCCVLLLSCAGAAPCFAVDATSGDGEHTAAVVKESDKADERIMPQIATDHMKRGEYEAALPYFQEAVHKSPQSAEAHNGLGVTYVALQKADQAIAELKEAIRLDPSNAEYHTDLGVAFAMQGDRELTLHHFDRAIQLAPNDPKARIELAKMHYLTGNFSGAADELTKALAVEESPETRIIRASTYRRSGEFAKAIKDCDELLNGSPDDYKALACRAFSRMRSGDLEGASQDAERVIASRSDNADVGYFVRGGVALMRYKLDESICDLSMAVELDPQRPLPYVLRGFVRFMKGEISDSIVDLETATKMSSDPQRLNYELDGFGWQVYKFRGILRSLYAGQNKDAIADLNQAIELNGNDSECFTLRGIAYLQQSKWNSAFVDFDVALQRQPKDELANYMLIQVLTAAPDDKLRDGRKAIELAQALNDRSPSQPLLLSQLAAAYSEAGEFKKAEWTQTKVLKMLDSGDSRTTFSMKVWWNSDFDLKFSPSRQSNQQSLELYKQRKPYRLAPRNSTEFSLAVPGKSEPLLTF